MKKLILLLLLVIGFGIELFPKEGHDEFPPFKLTGRSLSLSLVKVIQSNNTLAVEINIESEELKVTIYDCEGILIYENIINTVIEGNVLLIETEEVQMYSGSYILSVETNNNIISQTELSIQ